MFRITKNLFQEIYYIRVKGKRPKGCLYSKYHNTLSNLRREGLLKKIESKEVAQIDDIDNNLLNGKQ